MAAKFVTVYHPELEQSASVPAKSLPARVAKGWELVDEAETSDVDSHPTIPFVPEGDAATPNQED